MRQERALRRLPTVLHLLRVARKWHPFNRWKDGECSSVKDSWLESMESSASDATFDVYNSMPNLLAPMFFCKCPACKCLHNRTVTSKTGLRSLTQREKISCGDDRAPGLCSCGKTCWRSKATRQRRSARSRSCSRMASQAANNVFLETPVSTHTQRDGGLIVSVYMTSGNSGFK